MSDRTYGIRIDKIEDVREGDFIVTDYGNMYRLTGGITVSSLLVEAPDSGRDMAGNHSRFVVPKKRFKYALRPKPELPDKPGLWLDANDDLWVFVELGGTLAGTRVRHKGRWALNCACMHMYVDDPTDGYPPFRPYMSDADHE